MNKRAEQARVVIDVERSVHKKLKAMAVEEETSLRTLMLEAIQWLVNDRNSKQNSTK